MTYAYCRKPISDLDNQAISSVYEWADYHGLKIDELFFDDKERSKKSYEERELGLKVIPLLNEGDCLILSEISCAGRSLNEIDTLLNDVFYKKKIRFACVSMGMYIDYSFLSSEDEIIMNSISFAARLHKTITKEITSYALKNKSLNGVKLGGSSLKWHQTRNKKSESQITEENKNRGYIKTLRYLRSKETYLFLKIIKYVFIEAATSDDITAWKCGDINTKRINYIPFISLVEKLHKIDSSLFLKIVPVTAKSRAQVASRIEHLRRSILNASKRMGGVSFESLYDDNTVNSFSLNKELNTILDLNNRFTKDKHKSDIEGDEDYIVDGITISSESYSKFTNNK